jgi:hypothetical protein
MNLYEQRRQWERIRRFALATTLALYLGGISSYNCSKINERSEIKENRIELPEQRSMELKNLKDSRNY